MATDNDAAGRVLADRIEAIAQETGRTDLQITQDLPEGQGSDWNDVLRSGTSANRNRSGPLPTSL
jgi:hypothetical protein